MDQKHNQLLLAYYYHTATTFFMIIILSFLFVFIPTLNSTIIIPQPDPLIPEILNFLDQRLALVYPIIQTFKNTITSDPFGVTQTWVGPNICNYTGFYCDNPPDNLTALTVASIDLNGFRLAAPSLDGFIDGFPDLALFHANTNSFSGPISAGIAKLQYLYELDVSNNMLSGTFPAEAVLNSRSLTFLDIRFNLFYGSVPPGIFVKRLDVLFINDNDFVQRLPENLGETSVFYLTLANNNFTGPIPRSIGKASDTLMEVLFLNNHLTGCVPYEIGFLTKLTVLDAGNNQLTGPLPWSLGCLEAAEILNFAGNLLYGQVPEVVCALGNIVNLSLSDNYFTRVGPLCRKLIKKGILDVRNNCIYGYGFHFDEQRPIQECVNFFLHPRSNCFHTASFNFLPCKVPPWRSWRHPNNIPKVSDKPNKRHLLSYSALQRESEKK